MKNINLLFGAEKELVKSFSFSTMNFDRSDSVPVQIDGRWYTKHGVKQAVTLVANKYKAYNGIYFVVVGMSKQHPCDSIINKSLAYETAATNALEDPIAIFEVPSSWKYDNFEMFAWGYVNAMHLEFIKTRQEILNKDGYVDHRFNRSNKNFITDETRDVIIDRYHKNIDDVIC